MIKSIKKGQFLFFIIVLCTIGAACNNKQPSALEKFMQNIKNKIKEITNKNSYKNNDEKFFAKITTGSPATPLSQDEQALVKKMKSMVQEMLDQVNDKIKEKNNSDEIIAEMAPSKKILTDVEVRLKNAATYGDVQNALKELDGLK